MTPDTYESALAALSSVAVPCNTHTLDKDSTPEVGPAATHTVLAEESAHRDRATRFVYYALAYVVRKQVPIETWDQNDYAYIREIAGALDDGSLLLERLIWKEGESYRRDGTLVATAVSAFMVAETIEAAGDEDAQTYAANDHAYLCDISDLENPGNLFVTNTSA